MRDQNNLKISITIIMALLLIVPITTFAQIPKTFNYQGYLTAANNSNMPVNSTVQMTFALYDVAVSGTALWSEVHTSVQVNDGVYSVVLGSIDPAGNPLYHPSHPFDVQYYLGITVGTDSEMTPRQSITSTPYSFRAEEAVNADTVDGMHSADLQKRVDHICAPGSSIRVINVDGSVECEIDDVSGGISVEQDPTVNELAKASLQCLDGEIARYNNRGDTPTWECSSDQGTVYHAGTGIDLNLTTFDLEIPLELSGAADGIIKGTNAINGNYGFLGSATIGVYGHGSSQGVYGLGNSQGVYGEHSNGNHGSLGTSSSGVFGKATSTLGFGVYGDGPIGVKGISVSGSGVTGTSDSGRGVFGFATTDGIGGYFSSNSGYGLIVENGNTGIGTTAPSTKLQIAGGTDASLSNGSGFAVIGNESSTNLVIDNNEIIARNNGASSKLYLNKDSGNVVVKVLEITGGADLAEPFCFTDTQAIRPGMAVAIDPERTGCLRIADKAYDRTVAGIISGAKGINSGLIMNQEGTIADGSLPVALSGRVYALADASFSAIQPGDLLTTSHTPGHVMKVSDYTKAHGSIIGKSMSSLKQGQGLVLVLVTLQ